ncbi:group II intron reverse transcriptase domain-containing protein [Patescibacteria group bacterium]|nr:group II intron reverse transcriptase domain-containing protein [Patescibacteria group bacterium]
MTHCDYKKLYVTYLACRKNKRLKNSSAEFEFYLEKKLFSLGNSLLDVSNNYTPLPFSVFVVTQPKIREIFAAQFTDRIVHHLIVSHIQPIFEPKFIYDSYANRKDKGTHLAVKRLQKFSRKITNNGTRRAYYLQADIKSFFTSINHQILFDLVKTHVKDPIILELIEKTIFYNCSINFVKKGDLTLFDKVPAQKSLFHIPLDQGLPIGNLTSQFFANVYLNELDQYVKHTLKCKYYIRYVDDFIILGLDAGELEIILAKIDTFLKEKLALELHPNKCKIAPISNGIDFLGYVVRPGYVLVRKRVVCALKAKLVEYNKILENIPKDQKVDSDLLNFMLASINSYYAHFCHAQSYNLRKHLWEKHFNRLQEYFLVVGGYKHFKLK